MKRKVQMFIVEEMGDDGKYHPFCGSRACYSQSHANDFAAERKNERKTDCRAALYERVKRLRPGARSKRRKET